MSEARKPIFFCFCGPGASGKSTLCRALIERDKMLLLSISTTTRQPRGPEKDGEEYFFVDEAEFQKRVAAGRFIEHAVFNGQHYGTEKTNIERAEKSRTDLLFDIDYQGVEQMKKLYPEQTVTVFVFPPSVAVLVDRFRTRGTETDEKIRERLKIAKNEIAKLSAPGFSDYFLVNDELERALTSAQAIILAERCRSSGIPKELVQQILK